MRHLPTSTTRTVKKHLNLNSFILLVLTGIGCWVKYDVDKIRTATDQVPILANQLLYMQKDIEEMKLEIKLHDQRLRVQEDLKWHSKSP
jgi:hypothetical protein